MKIVVGDPSNPVAIVRRRDEPVPPSVGDLIEFVTDHDERRWEAVVTGRRFKCLLNETIVEVFAEQDGP